MSTFDPGFLGMQRRLEQWRVERGELIARVTAATS
jgi:hypothetical protein